MRRSAFRQLAAGNRAGCIRSFPTSNRRIFIVRGQSANLLIREKTWTTIVPTFLCPADERTNAGDLWKSQFAMTSYLGVEGKRDMQLGDGVFSHLAGNWGNIGVRIAQIKDGLSSTLMAGERPPSPNIYAGWWAGQTWDSSLWAISESGLPFSDTRGNGQGTPCPAISYFSAGNLNDYCHASHYWSFHSGGGNWLLCDGSVLFLAYAAGTTALPAMATINGGEVIPPFD